MGRSSLSSESNDEDASTGHEMRGGGGRRLVYIIGDLGTGGGGGGINIMGAMTEAEEGTRDSLEHVFFEGTLEHVLGAKDVKEYTNKSSSSP
uniref:Uncharacterized protein n=1 Tax=Cannabis sativa TaxID=3483 RepID=A0A803PZ73_CANSA